MLYQITQSERSSSPPPGLNQRPDAAQLENQAKLELTYLANKNVFNRDGETRRSKARQQLREATGMDDSQLEGWKVMLERNVSDWSSSLFLFSRDDVNVVLTSLDSRFSRTRKPFSRDINGMVMVMAIPIMHLVRGKMATIGVVEEVVGEEIRPLAVDVVEVLVPAEAGVLVVVVKGDEEEEEVEEVVKEVVDIRMLPGRGDMIRRCQRWVRDFNEVQV